MGKAMEETSKKKKKGRPSLLDLQKRNLLKQQEQQQHSAPHSAPNYKSATTPNPPRRSTRRNPNPDEEGEEEEEEEENAQLDRKKRREKKLKLVLKLPSSSQSPQRRSSPNSGSDGSESNAEEDDNAASNNKKRKINAIGEGSELVDAGKVQKPVSGANPTSNQQGGQLDLGPSTTLPDKKLLLFILDRLQKKDTYGVFSDPVDPKELPDYHEIIEHPMDFSTVRKKLAGGAYATLEHFEKDIFLICSNAMEYNSPDTIYFRQARSIQELAKKNFENLRHDSDDNEPERKVVRRGRPPTKNLKKPLGRPSLERTGSEFSEATLATGGENSISANYDMRKGPHLDKSGSVHGSSRNGDHNLLAENKFDWNDEFTGSVLKGSSMKFGKKQFVLDENRRHTYSQFLASAGGREPSVLATFGLERKQLMAVGLHSEQGYARSLARFAANLGPVAWNIASKRIERSLSAGITFGPGWVGENDVLPQRPLVPQALSVALNSLSITVPHSVDSEDKLPVKQKGDSSSEKQMPSTHSPSDGHPPSTSLPPTAPTSPSLFVANKSPEPIAVKVEASTGLSTVNGFNASSSNTDGIKSRSPFPVHQGPPTRPGMNGINGAYGFNLPAQMSKLLGAARPVQSSQLPDAKPRSANNSVNPEPKLVENKSKPKPGTQFPDSGTEVLSSPRSAIQARPSWQQKPESGPSQQQKPDLAPPDLNIRFQSPGSPSSGRVDSKQPDLALQL